MSSAHEMVHLVVLVNDVALEVPHVERLALEREDGLHGHRQSGSRISAFNFGEVQQLRGACESILR